MDEPARAPEALSDLGEGQQGWRAIPVVDDAPGGGLGAFLVSPLLEALLRGRQQRRQLGHARRVGEHLGEVRPGGGGVVRGG